jgi:hypothetical protein
MVSVNQLFDIVDEIAGVKLHGSYNLDPPKGVMGRNSDNRRIREYLDWEPRISLRTGLEKTDAWIYDEYLAFEKQRRALVSAHSAYRRASIGSHTLSLFNNNNFPDVIGIHLHKLT